ncbi:MAG TPA: bi-domain-containing oxidoreductase [Actinomycetota bacterium]|jgi:predicted dehydrogenase/threonine dehydrogenase-like Zn-dependent dehydrogenase|nr:bi-domain-containing oxidoreductase [Actinomycetota bacterium]
MKQIAQNYRSGELALLEVPVPAGGPGGVLVRTRFSLISTGTELMKLNESKLSLLGKARARPDQVRKVVQSVSQQGVRATYRKVSDRLDAYTPLGYSLSGEVVEVGAGVEGLAVGQRVACAGNRYALHAEYNWVPRNLCVPVPEGVADEHAAFTTVGAIAMQGYRQSEARLGETACVIGLGLVGQLLVQLLRAAGVQVVGLDPSPERCRLAERSGASACRAPDPASRGPVLAALAALSDGAGADHVFLTAGGDTNQPVELAAALARDRARVIDIGKCRLDLPWTEYYAKELEVRFSRSYGPGRYDPTYEEGGVDYPIGHVRWTERRNLACFLDLVAEGRLELDPLVSAVLPFEDAVGTYERIQRGEQDGVGVLFRYPVDGPAQRRLAATPPVVRPTRQPTARPTVRLGVIGAGSYATSMLLPHLRDRDDVRLVEVATATGLSAANAQRKFGFERCSTDHRGLLADEGVDAVLIATRHHAHAAMVCEALRAGKAVFVEKPLAVDPDQLEAILAAVEETGNDRLTVGFNRRFAPLLVALKGAFGPRSGPVQVRYDVNAGRLEAGSWYARPEEGPRLVGEGCHFVDTVSWWLDQDPVAVFAAAAAEPDDTTTTLLYPDGSVATIVYQTGGDPRAPKELVLVSGGGQLARLHNFQRTELWRGGRRHVRRSRGGVDKGQRQELAAFVRAVAEAGPMPVPLDSLVATTRATFAARRSLASRGLEAVAGQAPDGGAG